ncbi:MAG: ATP-binding protein, partial [Magnetococcales bacterium]|nr:ATP-binding protein [Magnetococcales bacterium]
KTLEINSYPGAFSHFFSNLIVNSFSHGFQDEESGKIQIQASLKNNQLTLYYSDNGRGMEEKDRLQIFEPFFTTARHRGGSGLGMHIVYNLVTQTLQGTIHCSSTPGQGVAFEIVVPLF